MDEEMSLNTTLYSKYKTLLGNQTYDDVSLWADRVKRKPQYKWISKLHYINITKCEQVNNISFSNNIANSIKFLRRDNYFNLTLLENFSLLVHLLQDVLQPLHSCGKYNGGNSKKIRIVRSIRNRTYVRNSNMHELYDKYLPLYFLNEHIPTTAFKTSYRNVMEIINRNVIFCCKIDWEMEKVYLNTYYISINGYKLFTEIVETFRGLVRNYLYYKVDAGY
jgi:hypothetical protein